MANPKAPTEGAPKRNIAQRLNAVMFTVTYVEKEKKQGMKYSIVSHDAVTAKVRPALVNEGVIYYPREIKVEQSGNRTQCVMTVRFENIDDRSDFIDVASMGYGIDEQDKGPGKAISYAVKYALLKALGLESGDDPDQDQETIYESPEVKETKLSIELGIEDATDLKVLNTLHTQIKAAVPAGLLDKATAHKYLAACRQKAEALDKDKAEAEKAEAAKAEAKTTRTRAPAEQAE